MDHYAVMGCPVSHSRSPFIHHEFARQTQEAVTYSAIHVETGGLPDAVAAFRAQGGLGLNLTLPFKEVGFGLADSVSRRARFARAVNTLHWPAGAVEADNTDGVGLVRDLKHNLHITLESSAVLLVGAGGAARGVVAPLLEQAPGELVVANRTPERARSLVEDAREVRASVTPEAVRLEALTGRKFDVVINATAASLTGEVPPLPSDVVSGAVAYDMMYGPEPTAFMTWALDHGAAQVADGLGMLVEQAAEAFFLWRGVRPRTEPVINALKPFRY